MSCPFGYGRKPDTGDAETVNDAPTVEAIVTDGVVGLKRCECGDGETKRGAQDGRVVGVRTTEREGEDSSETWGRE